MKLTYEQIAEACHENNRAYCHIQGDYTQPAWSHLTPEQKAMNVNGVEFHMADPDVSPKASHHNWVMQKKAQGWKYGVVKDVLKKEHPEMVPYGELSVVDRGKDLLFGSLVNVLRRI
jgi:hypothetical protein